MPKTFNAAKPSRVFAVRQISTNQFVVRPPASYGCHLSKNPSTYNNLKNAFGLLERAVEETSTEFGGGLGNYEVVEYEVVIKEVCTHHLVP